MSRWTRSSGDDPTPLLRLPARNVYYLPRTAPAVFFLADREAGGVLVNTPAFSPPLVAEFNRLAPLKFDYAFTDDFHPVKSRYGPGAARAINLELEGMLEPG